MSSVFTALIDAFKAGFGLAGDFGKMIQDTFTAVFIKTTTEGGTTVTGLSDFGAVAIFLVGTAMVTGLGMLIFRRFFKRS